MKNCFEKNKFRFLGHQFVLSCFVCCIGLSLQAGLRAQDETPLIGPALPPDLEAPQNLPTPTVDQPSGKLTSPCYLLPPEANWVEGIAAPKEFFGFELGEYHLRHHQLVDYLRYLAAASDRIEIEEIGKTHGRRPLLLLTVTAPKNLSNLESIQKSHRLVAEQGIIRVDENEVAFAAAEELTQDAPEVQREKTWVMTADGELVEVQDTNVESATESFTTVVSPESLQQIESIDAGIEISGQPDDWKPVIYMGYSVHGDESSGANSVPAIAYYLAASQSADVLELLDKVVILIDPCLNPDGFDRFANWANDFRGRNLVADPSHREHNQAWPGGRVNYYWFDLNRDWLPSQHPESQARLAKFHQWKPNVVLDFHEMGTNSTFFFQPGIPARNHPLTPERNLELTRAFAKYHSKALDSIGSIYFTEERFDDFYMGKGSTYPDLHGAVGILFEQASSRGHVQESIQGDLTFPFTIRNQFTCALSSLKATYELRDELRHHQETFYQDSLELAAKDPVRYYAFQAPGDMTRLNAFADLLSRHAIECYWLSEPLNVESKELVEYQTLVVPTDQPEYRFLLSMIERRTEFKENVFYDVSTWTLPLAFDLDTSVIKHSLAATQLMDLDAVTSDLYSLPNEVPEIGYALPWSNDDAPRMLARLLEEGLHVRVAQQPFVALCDGVEVEFAEGTLVLPIGVQSKSKEEVRAAIEAAGPGFIYPIDSGLTPQGIDLGSNEFQVIKKPEVLLVVGEEASRYEAGEAWHYLDTRIELGVTLASWSDLARIDLNRYTVVAMVSGRYPSSPSASFEKLDQWISSGGTLVTIGTAASWAIQSGLSDLKLIEDQPNFVEHAAEGESPHQKPYASAREERALDLISGAIFNTKLDLTHPLCYGFSDDQLPVFRNNRVFLEPSENPYANPAVYASEPLLSGYISDENLERIKRSACVVVDAQGSGRIIAISDNPNFRAFWWGSNRLFANTIFFGPIVEVP